MCGREPPGSLFFECGGLAALLGVEEPLPGAIRCLSQGSLWAGSGAACDQHRWEREWGGPASSNPGSRGLPPQLCD